jgi:hypothetical protein
VKDKLKVTAEDKQFLADHGLRMPSRFDKLRLMSMVSAMKLAAMEKEQAA